MWQLEMVLHFSVIFTKVLIRNLELKSQLIFLNCPVCWSNPRSFLFFSFICYQSSIWTEAYIPMFRLLNFAQLQRQRCSRLNVSKKWEIILILTTRYASGCDLHFYNAGVVTPDRRTGSWFFTLMLFWSTPHCSGSVVSKDYFAFSIAEKPQNLFSW
jgi:hypothetical protein